MTAPRGAPQTGPSQVPEVPAVVVSTAVPNDPGLVLALQGTPGRGESGKPVAVRMGGGDGDQPEQQWRRPVRLPDARETPAGAMAVP
jgi:hypothetical protein